MREEQVVIVNKIGLHARPAALLVKAASGFMADVALVKDGKAFNAKSMLAVMSSGVKQGDAIVVRTDGTDEEEALRTVVALVAGGFGEN